MFSVCSSIHCFLQQNFAHFFSLHFPLINRPLNEEEVRTSAPQVISCNDMRREVTVNMNIASKQIDRTFTFDKVYAFTSSIVSFLFYLFLFSCSHPLLQVFGPQTQQQELYDQAIIPIVNEVLEGFNCTIFAYGQTGTGKTFTMEGNGRKTKVYVWMFFVWNLRMKSCTIFVTMVIYALLPWHYVHLCNVNYTHICSYDA